MIDMEHYAGFWRRVLASFIDTLLFALLAGIVHYLFFGNENIEVIPSGPGYQVNGFGDWVEQGVMILITIVMWTRFLGTPGKLILGCHVVDAKTRKAMTTGQAVLRYVSYIVSTIPLGLGFLWIAWDKKKQGFHDKIAGTVVIVESSGNREDKDDESQKSLEQLMAEVR